MALPDSYTVKFNAVPAYFDAILDAQPPERFSLKFLENLGFTSTNDRLFIGVLKDLGFLNRDGAPEKRYFDFLDRSQAKVVLAEGIREAFSDLFAINTKAHEFDAETAKNKLRTLYAGKKTDLVIDRIAKTYRALCDYADFSGAAPRPATPTQDDDPSVIPEVSEAKQFKDEPQPLHSKLRIAGLQYHINVVLPETRDQAVYDAIFRSLREHLG
ncbi:MAG: DUF5343 domain-containing protein [Gemmatimonadales bacterium]